MPDTNLKSASAFLDHPAFKLSTPPHFDHLQYKWRPKCSFNTNSRNAVAMGDGIRMLLNSQIWGKAAPKEEIHI
jgi:hypothetical protein